MQKICISFQDFLTLQSNQHIFKRKSTCISLYNQNIIKVQSEFFENEIKMQTPSFGFRDFLTPGSRRGSIQVRPFLALLVALHFAPVSESVSRS